MLNKYIDIFGRTIVTWNTNPADFEIKDNKKKTCFPPYPVLKAHELISRKEADHLVQLGVLKQVNDYGWGAQ